MIFGKVIFIQILSETF